MLAAGKAGTQDERSMLVAFDLAPSVLKLAGVAVPEGVVFDGEEHSDLAVSEGKWKLLCGYDGGNPRLFDLFADPAGRGKLRALSTGNRCPAGPAGHRMASHDAC